MFWDRELGNAVLCTHGEMLGLLLGELAADVLAAAAPLDWPRVDLAAGGGQLATGPRSLSGPVGPQRPCEHRRTTPCQLTDDG